MQRLIKGGVYSRAAFILLGNMTCAAYPGSAHSIQPKFCQQAGKTFWKGMALTKASREINKNKLKMGKIGQVMSLAGAKLQVSRLAFWWCMRSHQYGDCQSSRRCFRGQWWRPLRRFGGGWRWAGGKWNCPGRLLASETPYYCARVSMTLYFLLMCIAK